MCLRMRSVVCTSQTHGKEKGHTCTDSVKLLVFIILIKKINLFLIIFTGKCGSIHASLKYIINAGLVRYNTKTLL